MADSIHPHKGPFVRDLKPGDRLVGFYLVQYKQLEPFRDRTRGEFLTLSLADRTGQLIARVWEGGAELAQSFAEGDVVKVAGDVEAYLGRTQIIVSKLRPAEAGEYDLRDFLPASGKDMDALLAAVQAAAERIQDPHLSALVQHFYGDPQFLDRLARAPAARKVHHAYLGGLLEHIAEVLALCEAVLGLYPEIDGDLLLTGALLRDVGKTREFVWEREIDYSDEGRLVGHVVIGAEMVAQVIAHLPDFPEDLSLRVRHMIASHHGRYEWGSPRRPQTLEAVALHHIEELTAQINRFSRLLAARREPGEAWTAYDPLLRRQLYAGREDDDELSFEEAGEVE